MKRKLLSCDCCKEALPPSSFSGNHVRGDYSYFCKSCQVWLRLFREVCSNDGREKCAPRGIQVKKYTPTVLLQRAWGIGVTK
jgi:hypothetical protein